MSVIAGHTCNPLLRWLRQEDHLKFKTRLGFIVKSYLQTKQNSESCNTDLPEMMCPLAKNGGRYRGNQLVSG